MSADTSQFAPRQSASPPGVRSVSINVCDTRVGDVGRSRLSEKVTVSGSMTAELPADDLPSDDHLQSWGSDLPRRQREAGVGHPGNRDGEQLAPSSLPFSAFGLLGRREVTLHSRHLTATSSQPPTATVGNRLCDDSTNIPPDHQDLSANDTSGTRHLLSILYFFICLHGVLIYRLLPGSFVGWSLPAILKTMLIVGFE